MFLMKEEEKPVRKVRTPTPTNSSGSSEEYQSGLSGYTDSDFGGFSDSSDRSNGKKKKTKAKTGYGGNSSSSGFSDSESDEERRRPQQKKPTK